MILPDKHLRQDRSLLQIGGEILAQVGDGRTVSELWERVRSSRAASPGIAPLSFDWFVLSLTFLYAMSALEMTNGLITIGPLA